jgi:hypothetical protein
MPQLKKCQVFTGLFLIIAAFCFCQEDRNSLRRAEQVMKALAAAYPERLGAAEFRNGDWAVLMGDIWYYYSDGRLLPESLRYQAAEYDPQPFYNYPVELPPWREPSSKEAERFRGMANKRSRNPPKRSQHFYDDLWRAHNQDESYQRVKTLRFLGASVMVHYAILEELALVEERIIAEAKNDLEVRAWVNSISTLDGWNWRSIAGTQSRSFHAYGAAIDILPKSLRACLKCRFLRPIDRKNPGFRALLEPAR